ncbi:DNA-binding XRE family transcriptional regulator [Pseudaminobacter salicylatoxidans]|uniref:DNA-binding XRE family transcriptional regulator n=2 Tax=Pseudaminobacter salicylatoxidans TaxID=93369 RepID=A0A316C4A6_PSESE|nr:DNA-binding XRE family transcriptional regulator [Pseudaminobacter salicylatoxidans]
MSFTLCLTFTFITFTFAAMTKLAEYLNSIEITDAAFAAKVGCDRSMITKLRAGKATPSLRLAAAISRETGLPIEALIVVAATSGEAA